MANASVKSLQTGTNATRILVIAVIVTALVALLLVTYLAFRDVPETGTPGKIDNAQGVAPQYPPAAPAAERKP